VRFLSRSEACDPAAGSQLVESLIDEMERDAASVSALAASHRATAGDQY
jgi:hypothetical protein